MAATYMSTMNWVKKMWFMYTTSIAAAAAAAKSLQCLTLCDPIDGSPPDSPIPEILQARTLEYYSPIKRDEIIPCAATWMDLVNGITDSMDMSLSKLRELVMDNPWGHKESDMTELHRDPFFFFLISEHI